MFFVLTLLFMVLLNFSLSFGIDPSSCGYGYYFNGVACEECGKSRFSPNVRIINGIEAIKGSYPAQVEIITSVFVTALNDTLRSRCGGTLINRRTVMTAAHCVTIDVTYRNVSYNIEFPNAVFPTYESSFKVYAGAHDLSTVFHKEPVIDPSIKVFNVVSVIKHVGYDNVTGNNDIALLILDSPVVPDDYINIACLPQKNINFPQIGKSANAVGWGWTSDPGTAADRLQNILLTVYVPSYCAMTAPSVYDSKVCAGANYATGGKGLCYGDSGSGMYLKEKINYLTPSFTIKDKFVVEGVASRIINTKCAAPRSPAIFTKVSYYIDWIKLNWVH